MYQHHEGFEEADDNEILWRYHDLARYIDLLLKRQLFFCRADRFEDPFEGKSFVPANTDEEGKQAKENLNRSLVTLNSWHLNTTENYAMWRIYARGTYGLAIQTTAGKLKQAFGVTDKPVFIGKVSYYDDGNAAEEIKNPLLQFVRKRKIYQYESELRCCYVLPENETAVVWQEQGIDNGIFIDVDIDTLIERIYISPYSPNWITEIVNGLHDKFGIKKEIIHSTVFEDGDY